MISVILPVCNQEKDIEALIRRIDALPVEKEIVVVNDCSKDNTESILRGLALNSLKVIHHVSNRGMIAAVRTGVINATGEFIFIQNGDTGIDLAIYLKLFEVIKDSKADMVLGVAKTKVCFSALILNILYGVKLQGWFSRYQLIRRESFLNLEPQLKGPGTGFEILTKALRKKMRVIEVLIPND